MSEITPVIEGNTMIRPFDGSDHPESGHIEVCRFCFFVQVMITQSHSQSQSVCQTMTTVTLTVFFSALGSHLPVSKKLLGDYAALLGGSKVV